ncbi:hypothetical protein [Catellatospora vulcania]|uniref:hypothetical protein n=1 Tax=Catellatospora vulcania TaxID=1460450 RepID=UPI0012D43628|nr:hypothetical protein [Catellatospora vulcania]
MTGSTNQVRSQAVVHRCTPVSSTGPLGRLIPHAARPDRWCWGPDQGFHPRSAPHQRVQLTPAAGLLTRGRTIGVRQAVALGAAGAHADLAHAFSELDSWVPFPDADVFAHLGWAVRHLDGADDDVLRDIVVQALRSIDEELLPTSWRRPLAIAAAGAEVSAAEQAWLRNACDAAYRRLTRFETGWPQPPADRQAWWDYAAARACTALRDGDWVSAARAVTDLYGLTGPDPQQAAEWLTAITDRAAVMRPD